MEYYSVQSHGQPLYMFMEYAVLINATHTCSQSLYMFMEYAMLINATHTCSQSLYMFMEYAMLINATHTCSQSLSIFIVFDVFQADQGVPQQETAAGESCTFRRTSSLTLNVTRREAGKRLVVQCRVNHPSPVSYTHLTLPTRRTV